jgi:hypothetical protein
MNESLDRAVERMTGGRPAAAPAPAPAAGSPERPATSKPGGAAALFTRWEEIAGTELAAFAKPVRLADGVLLVAVDHPARATAARAQAVALLERARHITGAQVERLSVTVKRP